MDFRSQEIFPQILLSVIIAAAVFFFYLMIETLYRAYLNYGSARIPVLTKTSSSPKVIQQNPAQIGAINLPMSENQLTGVEFSYSTFVYINEDTDDNTEGWKAIFYKGYTASPFPLLGPGVFVSSKSDTQGSPTLRVVMNTYANWFNPVDVNQIPFNKWFHLAVVLRKNTLEVYINGKLANSKSFSGTLPYQNYQPLNIFPTRASVFATPSDWKSDSANIKRGIPPGENFVYRGRAQGYISNLYYFSYAMTYSEIQSMMNLGPSEEFDSENMDRPPYLIDSWWTSRKGN
jgi:hypothetical protein